MKKKVYFIGGGYEVVWFVFVTAETNLKAIEAAEKMYHDEGWTFPYNDLEVADTL